MAKKSNNRKLFIILALILVAVVAVVIIRSNNDGKKAKEVLTAKVIKANIVERVSASGKVQPEVEVKISPDVSGEIVDMLVKEGDSVVKGQLLCRIRPDNYVSALDRANAAVNNSKASLVQSESAIIQSKARLQRSKLEYQRNKQLFEEKVISNSDWEQIETNYQVAKQELASAEASLKANRFNIESAIAAQRDAAENLRKTTIYSPVSGTVSKLSVEKGERVVGTSQMAGTEIMRIANLNSMEVVIDVNENDIIRVKAGDSAEIDVDSYSSTGKKFKGMVTEIANTAKANASADAVTEFEVKVRILPESYQEITKGKRNISPFRPGMTASVDIITESANNIMAVPIAAVTTRKSDAQKKVEEKEGADENKENPNVSQEEKKAKPLNAKPDEVVFVMVKEGDKMLAKLRKVKTGISDYENIAILEGLKEGEVIISGPYLEVSKDLSDGDIVKEKAEEIEETNTKNAKK